MTNRRPTSNEIVCQAFRTLLVHGFYVVDEDGVVLDGIAHDALLLATKPWRGELWRKFRELEDRLCPVKAFEEGRA